MTQPDPQGAQPILPSFGQQMMLKGRGTKAERERVLPTQPDPQGARLTADELATVFRAHRIGAISYEGDSWYAADAGYDYDPAEATMREAGDILARLARTLLRDPEAPMTQPDPQGAPL